MGVRPRTGLELLRDDKGVQNHWARRLIAIIIDAVIVFAAVVAVSAVFAALFLISFGLFSPVLAFTALFGAWWGIWLFVYSFLAEGLYSRTIGKQIMGLRVETVDGRQIDFRQSLVRNISKIYWVLLLLDVVIGLAMPGEMSQKWTDRYIGTKVEEKTHMTIIS